jgi:hypothetical protein
MNTSNIVVLDDRETWSTLAGARVIIDAEYDSNHFVAGSGLAVTIEELVACWQSQQQETAL